MRYCTAYIVTLIVPTIAWGAPKSYETILMHPVPLTIDGDLSDWLELDLRRESIAEPSSAHLISSPNDLSASFSAVVDRKNLYLAVWVTDDRLIFGTETFHEGANDDAVEVFIDGDLVDIEKEHFDENDGHIRIVRGKRGTVHLEGSSGIFWLSRLSKMPNKVDMTVEESDRLVRGHLQDILFPYSWELLGVEAASSNTSGGYSVEIGIPASVLQIEEFTSGMQVGLDFRVLDDDDGDGLDAYLDWSSQGPAKNLSFRTTYYGRLTITGEKIGQPLSKPESQPSSIVTGSNEVTLSLGSHPTTSTSAWRNLMTGSWDELTDHLVQLGTKATDVETGAFSQFLLARVYWLSGDTGRSKALVQEITKSPKTSGPLRAYGYKTLASMHENAGDVEGAEAALLKVAEYDDRNSFFMHLAEFYERTSNYSKAKDIYKKIVASLPSDGRIDHTAAFKVGLCHRYLGEYNLAREQFLLCQTKFGDDDGTYWSWMEYQLGSVALAEKDYSQALERFQNVLSSRRSGGDQEPYRYAEIATAQTNLMMGNRREGREMLSQIIENYPGTPAERDAHYLLSKYAE